MARAIARGGRLDAAALSPSRPHEIALAARVDWRTLAVGVAVTSVSAVIYALTAARDIVIGDSPEYVTVAATLGVAHPPGYPVVTMLGYLFSLIPVGSVPFRVNLLAVVCGALTVGLIYLTAYRLSGHRLLSGAAALLLAFNPLFWSWSLVIEAFPLNNLLAALMVYLLVVWNERPDRPAPLVAAAFVGGLGLANHQTIALLAPAVSYLLWRHRAILFDRPWVIGACTGAVLVGLLPYAYLPWAAAQRPPWSWAAISSVGDLVDHFLRRSYGTGQLVSQPLMQGGSPVSRITVLLESFTALQIALIALGAVQAYRSVRWYFWFAMLAFAVVGPFFAVYSNVNLAVSFIVFVLQRFFLLALVVTAPLVALGLVLVIDTAKVRIPRIRPQLVSAAAAGCVAIVVLGQVATAYAAVDQSGNHVASHFAEDILGTMPENSILLVRGDAVVFPVIYASAVERYRPDVAVVILDLLGAEWYVRQVRERYPDVVVPFDRWNGQPGAMKAFVQANRAHAIGLQGIALDDSLKDDYWFYGYGLVQMIEPMSKDVTLDTMVADNERLLGTYRVASYPTTKRDTFERGIVADYALPAYRVAKEFEAAKLYPQARKWYERALAVDPELPKALEALHRLATQ